jgi:hypothetical protein
MGCIQSQHLLILFDKPYKDKDQAHRQLEVFSSSSCSFLFDFIVVLLPLPFFGSAGSES